MDKPQPEKHNPTPQPPTGVPDRTRRAVFHPTPGRDEGQGSAAEDAESLGQTRAVGLSQHPEDRPQSPILLAVDQQLGEGRLCG